MEKEKELKEWELYRDEGEKFENGNFYTLFMESNSEDIERIYKNIQNSEKLILKMKKYLLEYNSPIQTENKKELLSILIKLDFEEKRELFLKYDHYNELINNWEFIYVDDYNTVESMYGELNQLFWDDIDDFQINEESTTYIIYDALYSIANNFDVQLYLFEPLLNLNYTGEYMMEFLRAGGKYAINDEDSKVYFSYKK